MKRKNILRVHAVCLSFLVKIIILVGTPGRRMHERRGCDFVFSMEGRKTVIIEKSGNDLVRKKKNNAYNFSVSVQAR